MRKLKMYVTVHEKDAKGNIDGESFTFGPGDDLPEWAEAAIENPDVWADEDIDEDDVDTGGGEPPRTGAGSGRANWAAYAESLGIEVPDGASRDEIIDLVDQQ